MLRVRVLIVSAALAAVAGLCAGCGNDQTPIAETPHVTQLESRIASFVHTHPAVAGVGPAERCAVRVLGRSQRTAYIEALCGSTSSTGSSTDLGCVPRTASEVDAAGVATLNSAGTPTAVRLDQNDDSAYRTWLRDNLPAGWQKYESAGPRFGALLESRLTTSDGCGR